MTTNTSNTTLPQLLP